MIEPVGDGSRENCLYVHREFEIMIERERERESALPLRQATKGDASAVREISQITK
jgi:hypothetical protein